MPLHTFNQEQPLQKTQADVRRFSGALALVQVFSNCSPWISHIYHHLGLVRNTGSQAPHQTNSTRNQGVGPAVCFNKPCRWWWCMLKFTRAETEPTAAFLLTSPFFVYDCIRHKTQFQTLEEGTSRFTSTPTLQRNHFWSFLVLDILVVLPNSKIHPPCVICKQYLLLPSLRGKDLAYLYSPSLSPASSPSFITDIFYFSVRPEITFIMSNS